jgi:hypothetical protein
MKNILQIIVNAGLTITDEQKAAIEAGVKENYRTVSDYEKQTRKVDTLTQERDNWKTQYDTAKETLDGFEGKDFDAITRERDDWKKKAETADADWKKKLEDSEKQYAAQLEERDFSDALAKAMDGEKFTSEFAKKGIMDMIRSKGFKREGDKILGLDDYMKELRESQKDAFAAAEPAKKPPIFTTPTSKGENTGNEGPATVPKVW